MFVSLLQCFRQIDFILAYERESPKRDAVGGGGGAAASEDEATATADEKDELLGDARGKPSTTTSTTATTTKEIKWRNKFLRNLGKRGLEMEEDVCEGEKADTVFIKVHAPFDVVCR